MVAPTNTFGKYGQPPAMGAGGLQYDPASGKWYNAATGQEVSNPENPTWSPDMQGLYQSSQAGLDKYYGSLPGEADQLTGLGKKIEEAGTYKGYNWNIPQDYELPDYQKFGGYDKLAMERTDFTTPQIDALKDVSPIAEGIYGGQMAKSNEAIGGKYKSLKSQVDEETRRNMARPEQAAALLSSLGVEEAKAKTEAGRDIQFEQAQQQLDLEKKAQELGLQRSTSQAGIEQTGQQMTASERQAAADYARQVAELQGGEGRYGYEQDVAKKQYGTGMETWLQEQQAAEAEKEYQSKYGQAQDLTSLQAQEWESNQASKYDLANALLQGQQAQTGLTSQAGTYMTNLPEDIQKDVLKSQPIQPAYNPQSYATTATKPQTQIKYSMPGQTTTQQTNKYSMPSQQKQATTQGQAEQGFANAEQGFANASKQAIASQGKYKQPQATSQKRGATWA